MKKVTFTLTDDTVRGIERAAERLAIPKSQVVREAIRVYGEQLGRLSEAEREEKLATFDDVTTDIGYRPRSEVEGELEEIRGAREDGGRGAKIE
jgi:metal-responsive CopG/Arc/MetJ family transcriptional regulator